MVGLLRKYVYQIGDVDMKIYIVVKHTDVEVFGMCGDTEFVTKTEIHQAYGNEQHANFEARYLNGKRSSKEYNILYDVIEADLT